MNVEDVSVDSEFLRPIQDKIFEQMRPMWSRERMALTRLLTGLRVCAASSDAETSRAVSMACLEKAWRDLGLPIEEFYRCVEK